MEEGKELDISSSNSLSVNVKVSECISYSLGNITTSTAVWQGGWVTDNFKTYYLPKAKSN